MAVAALPPWGRACLSDRVAEVPHQNQRQEGHLHLWPRAEGTIGFPMKEWQGSMQARSATTGPSFIARIASGGSERWWAGQMVVCAAQDCGTLRRSVQLGVAPEEASTSVWRQPGGVVSEEASPS